MINIIKLSEISKLCYWLELKISEVIKDQNREHLVEMKIFKRYEQMLAFAILRDKLAINQKGFVQNYTLGLRNPLPWFVFVSCFILASIFMFIKAETFKQQIDCFYILLTTASNAFIFTILVWKRSEIFELIDNIEELIEKRKLLFYHLYRFLRFLWILVNNTGRSSVNY